MSIVHSESERPCVAPVKANNDGSQDATSSCIPLPAKPGEFALLRILPMGSLMLGIAGGLGYVAPRGTTTIRGLWIRGTVVMDDPFEAGKWRVV